MPRRLRLHSRIHKILRKFMVTTLDDSLNNSNLITNTINELEKCSPGEMFEIGGAIRSITIHQLEFSSEEQDLYSNKPLSNITIFNATQIAQNIHATMNAPPSALQRELIIAVYNAAKKSLEINDIKLEDIRNIACTLDHINYTDVNPNDPIYQRIVQILDPLIFGMPKRCAEIDVWCAFSLRKVQVRKFPLYYKFCNNILNKLTHLRPLEISLAIMGFAQARFKNDNLFVELRNAAINKKDLFLVSEVVNMLWSFCSVNWLTEYKPSYTRSLNFEMIEIFKPKLIKEMDNLNVDQAVRIAMTFKNMNITDSNFFDAVRSKIDSNMHLLTNLATVTITIILSSIHGKNDSVLPNLLMNIGEKMTFNPRSFFASQLADISYSVLIKFCQEDDHFDIYSAFLKSALEHFSTLTAASFKNKVLWHIRTIAKIYIAKTNDIDLELNEALKKLTTGARPQIFTNVRTSEFHLDIKRHLDLIIEERHIVHKFVNELTFEGYFRLDIASEGYKLAIECDGQCHLDETGKYMPKNIIKETLLQIGGWNLVRIKSSEWPRDDVSKKKLLLSKLEKFFI